MEGDLLRIVAVVVTYNRKNLLADSLRAILHQTRVPDSVFVVDNASTDGTSSIFVPDAEFCIPQIHYVRLGENAGGAGGFKEGIRLAVEESCDWCWIMDDDVVPRPNALAELIKAYAYLHSCGVEPSYLASHVSGAHGEVMNVPNVSRHIAQNGYPDWCEHLPQGIVRIGSATFVSLLISARAIELVGLPISDYFLWGDDAEYTTRLTSYYGPAFVCGGSQVTHLRSAARAVSTEDETDAARVANRRRAVRNELINASYYDGPKRTIRRIARRTLECGRILFQSNKFKAQKVRAIGGGIVDFLTRCYDIEDLAKLDKKDMRHY